MIGPAGIGKHRLAWEFLKYVDGLVDLAWWHAGRSPAYGEGITFWALGEIVRARAGLRDTISMRLVQAGCYSRSISTANDDTSRRPDRSGLDRRDNQDRRRGHRAGDEERSGSDEAADAKW